MTKKLCGVLFIVVVLQVVWTIPAAAQTATTCVQQVSCGAYSLLDVSCAPSLPAGATDCSVPSFSWTMNCEDVSTKCGVPMVWCPTCGKYVPAGGAPINLTNGNTYIQESDVRIPGLGGGLTLERTWNSVWPASVSSFQNGMFGANWRSNYEERVFPGSGEAVNYMEYLRGDGSVWYFGNNSGSTWTLASPANTKATLTQSGSGPWTLTFQNGEQRVFSYTSGQLTTLVDRNGNSTQLTYDSSNRLITVTDPASRYLSFTYASGSSTLVTGVTSSVGVSLSYSYDSQGRLTQVTEPDLTTVSFTYNSQSLISSVTDSNGNTLESHTYDSQGRGLTSSRASGVEAVTVSYPD